MLNQGFKKELPVITSDGQVLRGGLKEYAEKIRNEGQGQGLSQQAQEAAQKIQTRDPRPNA